MEERQVFQAQAAGVAHPATIEEIGRRGAAVVERISQVLQGKRAAAELVVIAVLAEGHVLIEDVPGVGKTTLAKALAASIDGSIGRIQFTPDLLPSDVVGANVFRAERGEFEFLPGPIFANIVIGDEVNRASPKTQSALLEAMQEGQVTVDGMTYELPRPFIVIATQNPIEMEGTYPLPEAQRDRFMAHLAIGYPDAASEVAMLDSHELNDPLEAVTPVTDATELRSLIAAIRGLYIAPALKRYVVDLAHFTRQTAGVALGASPRASIQLVRAAKASAALDGRDHVVPDDVQRLAPSVWAHRIVLNRRHADLTGETVVRLALEKVPVR
ncbi:MAG: AAA family ATPase [Propionibacteriaceae bacterium]|jgi:MoxR-like ATPase|nr:AAA family ATPase [Propionibacteriaceae bacterium]